MSTLFVWTGTAGPNWDSTTTSGTDIITNWKNVSTGKMDVVPTSDTGDVAEFNDGGIHTVGGGGSADQISVTNDTTVTFTNTGTGTGRYTAGASQAANNADFPDDLVVDNSSKVIVASGAGIQNDGSVTVIGLGNDLFGGGGDGTLEVDPGGLFTGDALIIGDGTAGNGDVSVNGALEFVVAAPEIGDGQVTIGQQGVGTLDISATPVVFTQGVILGLNQGAVGTMALDSSTWGGGSVTVGAAGTGHMTIGAGATVALTSLVVGAAQTGSGDLTVAGSNSFMVDFLTIGSSGTGTATFGAGSFGTFAAVTVGESAGAIANMTLDGSIWNASGMTIGGSGTGHVTVGAGEVVTVFGDDVLGAGSDASGDLTVDGAVLNGGTLAIGQDGTGDLEIGSGSSGSVTVVVVGEDAGSSGTLTIDDANWNAGSLTVGQTGTGQATVGTGATATLDNILIGPNGNLAVTETAGSVGTVIAQQVTLGFGTLDLSAFGQVLIGAAAGANGAVAIGAKSSLTGVGLLNGDVVLSNGGIVAATAPVPGALKIDGHISGNGTIQPLMTLEANGVIDSGVTIGFSPSIGAQVGDLVLDVPSGESGTITGFSPGNTIDLKGVAYTDAVFTQGTSGSPGTLTLSGGTSSPLSLSMIGDYASNAFTVTPVTLSGAGVQAASPVSGAFAATSFAGTAPDTELTVSCFAAGTRIATAGGPVAVEDLRIGDRVVTADGRIEPIRWIGSRTIDCARHPTPDAVWPVRVAAGAFGENVPHRDLFLSPDHAVFVDGSLVPVKLLVNGADIVQMKRPRITYYHIELPCHELVLAEGLAVESYLDVGDRINFAGETTRLFPDFAPRRAANAAFVWETSGAAPLRLLGKPVAA